MLHTLAVVLMPFCGTMGAARRWLEGTKGLVAESRSLGGSPWASRARYVLEDGRTFFVKTCPQPAERMFRAEAMGLRSIAATDAFRVPAVVHYGDDEAGSGSFLILEFVEGLRPLGRGAEAAARLGHQLGHMHRAEPPVRSGQDGRRFGFPAVGTIGGSVQPNTWAEHWPAFWIDRRICHQLRLARDGDLREVWKKVMTRTSSLLDLFDGVDVEPRLIHGDLWEGNVGTVEGSPDERVVLFDPAAYYAHSEAEFGMWPTFLTLDSAFWEAYRTLVPEQPGFSARRPLYRAWHLLNHLNLFGGADYKEMAYDALQDLCR